MRRGVVKGSVVMIAMLAVLGMSACGDKAQTAGTRKADTSPYASATGTHTAAGWQAGDTVSWERQLSNRAQYGQNEYTRTGMAAGAAASSGPAPAPATAAAPTTAPTTALIAAPVAATKP